MKDRSYKRHLAKTVTWRLIGTIDTFLLAWFISGSPYTGLKIGLSEVLTKMVLYYLHERLWFRVPFGLGINGDSSKRRHLAKTVSWRIVGTLDTMLLAWLVTGSAMTGFKIGIAEVVTKMLLYYLHERAWYKLDFGVKERRRQRGDQEQLLQEREEKSDSALEQKR